MKKVIFTLSLIFCVGLISLNAQPDFTKMREEQKIKLKEEVKLNDAQADSVMAIQQEFRPKMRGMRGLPQEDRMAKEKEINDAMKKRLKEVLKDDALVEKVVAFQEKQKQERMNRMRENRPQE